MGVERAKAKYFDWYAQIWDKMLTLFRKLVKKTVLTITKIQIYRTIPICAICTETCHQISFSRGGNVPTLYNIVRLFIIVTVTCMLYGKFSKSDHLINQNHPHLLWHEGNPYLGKYEPYVIPHLSPTFDVKLES